MNLSDCYLEEDLFPKIFTDYEERNYGILFYNEDNKDSFDSNHAVIYRDKTEDLPGVLSDIVRFYSSKGPASRVRITSLRMTSVPLRSIRGSGSE